MVYSSPAEPRLAVAEFHDIDKDERREFLHRAATALVGLSHRCAQDFAQQTEQQQYNHNKRQASKSKSLSLDDPSR